jgi:hypothetical protein
MTVKETRVEIIHLQMIVSQQNAGSLKLDPVPIQDIRYDYFIGVLSRLSGREMRLL